MNAITVICLVLGAAVIATAVTAAILWVCDLEANGWERR